LRARTLIILYHRGEGRGAGHCHFSVIDARVIYRFPHLTTKSALFYANLSFFCHRCKSHFQIYRSPHLTTKSAFFMQICHFSVIDARVIFRFAHLTTKSTLFYAIMSFFCHRCKSHFQIFRISDFHIFVFLEAEFGHQICTFLNKFCHLSVIDAFSKLYICDMCLTENCFTPSR
jgi:hypothetical protein